MLLLSPQTGEICLDVLKDAWTPMYDAAAPQHEMRESHTFALCDSPWTDSSLFCPFLILVVPSWTLESTCRAIIALLGAPDASSPLNCDAGNLLRTGDTLGFNSIARMYTLEYASETMPSIHTQPGTPL